MLVSGLAAVPWLQDAAKPPSCYTAAAAAACFPAGYGTEAISYVVALLQTNRFRREDIWISHSGDQIKQHVADSLDHETLQLLQASAAPVK
jgi:predicted Rossmann-fold nucleotide-binding protein